MRTELRGVDEFYNSAGVKFGPLGFGLSNDWEVISRQVVSGASAVTFTFDPTLYDEYEISILEWVPGTDGVSMQMRTSTNGGSSFDSGASDYSFYRRRATLTTTPGGGTIAGSAAATAITFADATASAANRETSFKIFAGDLGAAVFKKFWGFGIGTLNDGNEWDMRGSGMRLSATAVNALQFFASTGTVSGTFILRARRKVATSLVSQDDWAVITDDVSVAAAATHNYFWDDQAWDEIEVVLWGAVTDTDIKAINIRLSTDGSTFHSAAANYKFATQNSNSNSAAGSVGNSSVTEILAGPNMGTGADEHLDITFRIHNVSNTARKKTLRGNWSGLLSDGFLNQGDFAGVLMANNNSIRGFQIVMESPAQVSFDRVRIRGRRLTPIGTLRQDWELIEEKIVTGTTANLDFTDIPVSEFDELELVIKDADTDTTVNNIAMRMSNDNGATFDSGTNYHSSVHNQAAENSTYAELSSATGTAMTLSANFGSTTVRVAHGRWYISGMASGSRPNIFGQTSHINDSGNHRNQVGGGNWNGTGSDGVVTAFRLICDNGGSFTAGTFTLRGRRRLSAS